ncbi:hypothetical protein SmJEL517_g03648 [Synchytrium microbalum]|uniref:Actin-related protein 8 n=1 Tax=Synchytrium microbalum TaxID=1806994 RepID=A0A507BXI3_9FUNG|nr:uncharacterized protein SmJEL517_g03648 [Synchytrium microbalum]TPX33497.1 hypothetical protein SmJEL517_g03648 [Synchytrium microbalum]
MSVPFVARDGHVLVVETGSYRVKAGVAETTGTVLSIPTLVGSRSHTTETRVANKHGGMAGHQQHQKDGDDGGVATANNNEDHSNDMDVDSQSNNTTVKRVVHTERFCGDLLDDELQRVNTLGPTQQLHIKSAIENGLVSDWGDLEALLANMLARHFLIRRRNNTYPIMFVVPTRWSKLEWERLAQMAFERLNVPGLYVTDQALMTTYGCNVQTALVINIGHDVTEVTPVVDNIVLRYASRTLSIGSYDIDSYMAQLLQSDTNMVAQLSSKLGGEQVDWIQLARTIKESNICEVRSMPAEYSKKDLSVAPVEFEYKDVKINVGFARTHAADVLFDPKLVGKNEMSLPEAIVSAVAAAVEVERRKSLWESLILTGAGCLIKGMPKRMEQELAPFIAAADTANENQAKEVNFLKCPEFFVAYKERPHDWSFLGTSVLSKYVFIDTRSYTSKVEYNEYGPSVITSSTPRDNR